MSWTTLDLNNLLAGEPLIESEVLALYENPIAIAEGDPDAPRVVDDALDTTATNAGRDWVLARNALSGVGAVGTYALLRTIETEGFIGEISAGATRAGSTLRYATAGGDASGTPSGTWRLMGFIERVNAGADSAEPRTSLWLRIS